MYSTGTLTLREADKNTWEVLKRGKAGEGRRRSVGEIV